jgi:hypothetical protein
MVFPSPSQRNSIELWQTELDNTWKARVELVTGQKRIVLQRITRQGAIYFVHVYWSPNEERVGALGAGFSAFRVAYDLRSNAPIPFELIRPDLGRSIAQTYHLPPGEDPFLWALSGRATDKFFEGHPDFKLTYR